MIRTVAISVACREHSFNNVKPLFSYLRVSTKQALALLNINCKDSQNTNFDDVIGAFASPKAQF